MAISQRKLTDVLEEVVENFPLFEKAPPTLYYIENRDVIEISFKLKNGLVWRLEADMLDVIGPWNIVINVKRINKELERIPRATIEELALYLTSEEKIVRDYAAYEYDKRFKGSI